MFNLKNLKSIKAIINKNILYYLISLFLLVGFGYVQFIIPKISEMIQKKDELTSSESELPTLKQQAMVISASLQAKKPAVVSSLPVSIYVSPYKSLDLESAGFELVDQLIEIFESSGNKISEISFLNQPVQNNVGVLTVNIALNTSYVNLQKVLSKVYAWKYLAGIKSVKIDSNNKNLNLLSIALVIDLYVKRD